MADLANLAASSTIAPAQLQIFTRNREASLLLQLPAELRNQIWEHVFIGTEFVLKYNPRQYKKGKFFLRHVLRTPSRLPMELLYTCRQTHQEAALLLPQLSVFTIWFAGTHRGNLRPPSYEFPHPLQMLPDGMTAQQLSAVRTVNISVIDDLNEFHACMYELGRGFSKGSNDNYNILPLARLTGLRHMRVWIIAPNFDLEGNLERQQADAAGAIKLAVKRLGVHQNVQVSIKFRL